jgi:hypothetical protein
MLIVVFGQMVMIMNHVLYSSLLVYTSATWLLIKCLIIVGIHSLVSTLHLTIS